MYWSMDPDSGKRTTGDMRWLSHDNCKLDSLSGLSDCCYFFSFRTVVRPTRISLVVVSSHFAAPPCREEEETELDNVL